MDAPFAETLLVLAEKTLADVSEIFDFFVLGTGKRVEAAEQVAGGGE